MAAVAQKTKGRPRQAARATISVRIREDLLSKLDGYRETVEFYPERSAVIEVAIKAFLVEKGFDKVG